MSCHDTLLSERIISFIAGGDASLVNGVVERIEKDKGWRLEGNKEPIYR